MIGAGLYALGAAGMFVYLRRNIDHPGRDASLGMDAAISAAWLPALLLGGLVWAALAMSGPFGRTRVYRQHFRD